MGLDDRKFYAVVKKDGRLAYAHIFVDKEDAEQDAKEWNMFHMTASNGPHRVIRVVLSEIPLEVSNA